jgi:hypothetical protein
MSETLTHWKKNNDSRYISGEDLKHGESLAKGLRPEMVVYIESFENMETFDQNEQKKVVKTGFIMRELIGNKQLYKPVILNNVNAAFCIKEFKSEFMEHWLNKPLVLYAMPDKRHGFVARFKKYFPPAISDVNALTILNTSTSLDELRTNWTKLNKQEQALPSVMALKEQLKTRLA